MEPFYETIKKLKDATAEIDRMIADLRSKRRDSVDLILAERVRQTMVEGYTLAHDDEHEDGELALLAAAYALSSRPNNLGPSPALSYLRGILESWEWEFNPKTPIEDLTRAGALILAEIERRLRAEEKKKMPEDKTRFADMVQLPRWQSHKIVAGDKIVKIWGSGTKWDLACGATIETSVALRNRVPNGIAAGGGYYVRYEDGYESWSPAEAFEKGYTRLP